MTGLAPCIVCGKGLDPAYVGDGSLQPMGAVALTTAGHYGSAVFEAFDGSILQVNVCDACLVERQGRVVRVTVTTRHEFEAKPWDPEED
jgi:hypothetical protein